MPADLRPATEPLWLWIDRQGTAQLPSSMITRHLFYTLRMIWNNFMPPAARVGDFRPYTFDLRTHPPEYLMAAILNLGTELFSRTDLRPDQIFQLDQMRQWIADNNNHTPIAELLVLPRPIPAVQYANWR
jgi:hypothetical protein